MPESPAPEQRVLEPPEPRAGKPEETIKGFKPEEVQYLLVTLQQRVADLEGDGPNNNGAKISKYELGAHADGGSTSAPDTFNDNDLITVGGWLDNPAYPDRLFNGALVRFGDLPASEQLITGIMSHPGGATGLTIRLWRDGNNLAWTPAHSSVNGAVSGVYVINHGPLAV